MQLLRLKPSHNCSKIKVNAYDTTTFDPYEHFRVFKKLYLENDDKIKLILVGSVSIILLQVIIHVGVNIKLFPTTGMTLPFISYGGSSIISTSILSGIILNSGLQ